MDGEGSKGEGRGTRAEMKRMGRDGNSRWEGNNEGM